jgi:hypothetical protein
MSSKQSTDHALPNVGLQLIPLAVLADGHASLTHGH